MAENSLVRIFIGAPLEHQSDLDALQATHTELIKSNSWAFIFANINVSGRQLDLVIFNETTTLVIEAKAYTHPIYGNMNRPWEQRGPYGTKKIRNAYMQALDAKNALHTELQRVTGSSEYPNALVALMPISPYGSEVTQGDYKVTVGEAYDIKRMLNTKSKAVLTKEQCAALAQKLYLEEVENVEAALSKHVLSASRLLKRYVDFFTEFYSPQATKLMEDQYGYESADVSQSEVKSLVIESPEGLLIHGPSGCGKSLLLANCAMSCIDKDCIPIIVSAKDFNGQLQNLLDREVALLNSGSIKNMLTTSRLLGKRIMLFVDGYNECRDDFKSVLTRSLKAFALRFGAGLVISSQHELQRSELLEIKTISVRHPSDGLKATLARVEELGEHFESCMVLLNAARSGLEAELVGKVGSLLPTGASKFVLFDTYARYKLGANANEGIRFLSYFAKSLNDRACFSLSIREIDRLQDASQLSQNGREYLLRSELIHYRGERVSFAHELFYSAFAAEAVIRSGINDISLINAALHSPRFHSSRTFITGGIEDECLLKDVLEATVDFELLAACNSGECGAVAQFLVKRKISSLLDIMIAEAPQIDFELIGEGLYGVTVADSSIRTDTNGCKSYLQAIQQSIMKGLYFESVMTACKHIDEAISKAETKLAIEAKVRKIPLKHALFFKAYVLHCEPLVSQLVSLIHSNRISDRTQKNHEFEDALRKAWSNAETLGQYYFLLGVTQFSLYTEIALPYVVSLLKNIRSYPYHLQLDLMDFVQYLRNVDEPYRTQIIELLHENIDKLGVNLNAILFEALQAFDGLQDEEMQYIEVIRNEISDALTAEGLDADRIAWRLFSSQFDHPFDSLYWDEIDMLDVEQKKLLYRNACRGASGGYLSFLGILIRKLSEFDDPALACVIEPWTTLPDENYFMPQDAIEVFISAHEALGYLGKELPKSRGKASTIEARALLACGELFYWSNRPDIKHAESSDFTRTARTVLLEAKSCVSAGTICLTMSNLLSNDGGRKSLVNNYPKLALVVCREALKNKENQTSFYECSFKYNVVCIAQFSIQVLGLFGDRDDLYSLRELSNDPDYGVTALDAIRTIEARIFSG